MGQTSIHKQYITVTSQQESEIGMSGVAVRYFGSLSGIKMIVIPDNECVNSSIFCTTDTGTQCQGFFSYLAIL